MNRAVEWIWEDLTPKMFGYILLYAVENFPEICEKVREKNSPRVGLPHPEPIVKYTIRHLPIFQSSCESEKVSLDELKKGQDPLGSVTFWRFNGKFGFHKEKGTFVPSGYEVEKSWVMKEIYDKIEARRIEERWEEAKKYIDTADGEPTLSYE